MSDGLYIGGSDWSLETVCVGVGVGVVLSVVLGVVVVGNGRYRSRYRNPSIGIGYDTGLVILVILVILVVEEEERGAVNRKNGMSPGILRDILTNDLTHHRILAHENLGSSTKSLTCFLELGRTDIVDFDDEGFGVGGEKGLHTFEVFGFAFGRERHGG